MTVRDDRQATLDAAREHLLGLGVDGAVVIAWSEPSLGLAREFASELPTAVVAEGPVPDGLARAHGDNAGGVRQAVEALLTSGRRRIAHLAGPDDWLEARVRRQGGRLPPGMPAGRSSPSVGTPPADTGGSTRCSSWIPASTPSSPQTMRSPWGRCGGWGVGRRGTRRSRPRRVRRHRVRPVPGRAARLGEAALHRRRIGGHRVVVRPRRGREARREGVLPEFIWRESAGRIGSPSR
nr:hypothetical protein [Tessaracoccus coleopterorum]